ncbi:hypothetical protein ON010_g11067 [Phytophthora cinnamomi]|nr:hypothetical protein ON010_g11067 [Phytophthora cinnamomi]
MNVFQDSSHDSTYLRSSPVHSDNVQQDTSGADSRVELRLHPGERYGWWGDHEPDETHEVAVVHGAVNECRTKIPLNSGASISMLSFDFARKLKLKLQTHKKMKVSGLGGVPTYISAHAEVKITLGARVVYVFRLWVTNIGEGVDVLLGMNPDEETILMYGELDRTCVGLDLPVRSTESLYLRPGQSAIIRIDYGQSNPQSEVIWAGVVING